MTGKTISSVNTFLKSEPVSIVFNLFYESGSIFINLKFVKFEIHIEQLYCRVRRVKSVSRSAPPPVGTNILQHVSIPLAEKRLMTSEPITRVKLQKCG